MDLLIFYTSFTFFATINVPRDMFCLVVVELHNHDCYLVKQQMFDHASILAVFVPSC